MSVPLPSVPKHKNWNHSNFFPQISFQDCLKEFARPYTQYRTCAECKGTSHTLSNSVLRFPPILFVSLQRFYWDQDKQEVKKVGVAVKGLNSEVLNFSSVQYSDFKNADPSKMCTSHESRDTMQENSLPEVTLAQLISLDVPQDLAEEALKRVGGNLEASLALIPALSWSSYTPTGLPSDGPRSNDKSEGTTPLFGYILRGMITHLGPNAECGHYVAYLLLPGQGWFSYDDSKVRKCVAPPFESAYVYYFERVGT